MTTTTPDTIKAGDSLIRASDSKWAEPKDFNAPNLVVLIHGFTASGKYLEDLGTFIERFGYQAFIFNYNSYRGIQRASESIADFLLRYDKLVKGAISKNKVFFVAHSMGGLVARHLALRQEIAAMIRGIIMLGAPNDGCFPSAHWLSFCIEYGEYLSELMPEAGNPACLSAKELVKSDQAGSVPLIDSLNRAWAVAKDLPPSMTISGGKRYLSVSRSPLRNWMANRRIQAEMGIEENDGLVMEKSAAFLSSMQLRSGQEYIHFNSYPYYRELNHTHLKENQTLALEIIDWFGKH